MNLAQAIAGGQWVSLAVVTSAGNSAPLIAPPANHTPTAPTIRMHSADEERTTRTDGRSATTHILDYIAAHPASTAADVADGLGWIVTDAAGKLMYNLFLQGRIKRVGQVGKAFQYVATPDDELPEPPPKPAGHRRGLLRFSVCKVLLERTATRTELYAACDERVRDGLDSLLTRMLKLGEVTRKRDPMAASYAYTLTQRGRDLATGRA